MVHHHFSLSVDITLTPDTIIPVVKEVKDWSAVVSVLVVPSPIQHRIVQRYPTEAERSCAAAKWWLNTVPSPSWKDLALDLYHEGEDRAVEKVAQYLPKGTCMPTHMESGHTAID